MILALQLWQEPLMYLKLSTAFFVGTALVAQSDAAGMVREQIESRGIRNPAVLRVMRETPRHLFMPASARGLAYADQPVEIGHRQTISQPYIVALMTELLEPSKTQTVLEIGTGSGYQAAILSPLVARLYTIEIVPELAHSAATLLGKLGYKNV